MTVPDQQPIGLIADSHGNLEATAEAIRLLKGRGAGLIVHLGDFCDSIRRDGAAAMISLLEDHGVLAVKGNNDFLVENMLADGRRPKTPEGERASAFLKTVPVMRALGGIRFAHSLPIDSLRSFYTPIDTGDTRRAVQVFAEADFQILFCGHSHLPALFREVNGRVTRETMGAGGRIVLPTGREEGPPRAAAWTGSTGISAPAGGLGAVLDLLDLPGERGAKARTDRTDAIATREWEAASREGSAATQRFIVVVGAADDGECALYDRAAGAYERLRIFT